ncbi:hypothetical protein [Mycetocola sp.]|uniref:hypothetical protein n=1 Tax=Mycetocola sp. TaxID=1871042 RepID=UPI003988D318
MSNTTPDFSDANRDGAEPPTGPASAANEDAPRDQDATDTREYDAPLTPAAPADQGSERQREHAPDAGAPLSDEFDPDAFRDSLPATEPDSEPTVEPAAVEHARTAEHTAQPAPQHHHTPEVADQAYSETADTHVLSSSEPTVLTQADLEADKVLAEESVTPRDSTVHTDATAPVVPAPAQERAEPEPSPAPVRQPVYVQAPSEPKAKGNRGFGILVSLLATVVFAVLYAAALAVLLVINNDSFNTMTDVVVRAPFWIPVIFFFLGMVLLVSVVNRGGWWAYVLGGFVVAAIVYGSYLGGLLIEQAANISPSEVGGAVLSALLTPAAVISFIIAREVPIWFGAWVASRGRKVTERNREAKREYERILDQGPVVS